MLTPRFDLTQNDAFVVVSLRCPHVKSQEVEFVIDGTEFTFHARPYYVKLHFPHAVIEDGRERAQYDIATGIITVHLPKAEHGQWFEDLGLMTRLLAKRSASGNATAASATAIGSVPPMTSSGIEVLSSTTTATVDDGDDNDTENLTEDHIVEMMRENFRLEFTDHDHDDGVIDDAGNEDVVELQGRVEPSVEPLLTSKGYGFNSAYRGLFAGFEEFEVLQDMLDVGNPEIALRSTTVDERRQRRRDMEDMSFDEDRYVADFMDAEMVDEVCKWRAWWDRMREEWEGIVGGFGRMSVDADMPEDADVERRRLAAANDDNAARPVPRLRPEVMFSERDNEIMERLAKGVDGHRLKFTFDSPSTLKQHYLSLVTILFAATYNHRTNTGDNTVESAWTIVKLSPTLSWFEHPRSIVDAASMVTRRALCFPLYRSWTLATRCLRDVVTLLHLGKPAVVKVLLDAMDIVEHCEDAWRVGKVWLEDYARWMQFEEREGGASEEYLQAMAKELERIVEGMEQNGGCECHGAALCKRDVTFGAWNIQTLEELAMEDAMDGDDDDEQSASSSSITTSSESESDCTTSDTMSDTTSSDSDSDDEDYDFTYRPELPVLPARRAFASTPTRRSPLIQVISSEDLQCGGSDSKDEGNTDDDHYMLQ